MFECIARVDFGSARAIPRHQKGTNRHARSRAVTNHRVEDAALRHGHLRYEVLTDEDLVIQPSKPTSGPFVGFGAGGLVQVVRIAGPGRAQGIEFVRTNRICEQLAW